MVGPGRPGRPRGSAPPPSSTRGRGGRRPGRPRQRRDSNSTVASVDANAIVYVPETAVFKKTKLVNSDAWPTFVLNDAVVYRKTPDGQLQFANVCNVDLEGPFVVRGKVEIDPHEHKHHLRTRYRNVDSAYIEIAASVNYSIGIGPSPLAVPVVWAGGQAGWFELNPAPEYAAMHDIICEGISFYYSVMDVYHAAYEKTSKGKKGKPNVPLEKVLFEYAVITGDGLTLPEAKRRVQKHALFLISQFPKEGLIEWPRTSLAKWLDSQNKELVAKIEDAKIKRHDAFATGKPLPPGPEASPESSSEVETKATPQATRESDDQDVQMEDAPPSQLTLPSRVVTPIPPPQLGKVPSAPRPAPSNPPVASASAVESGSQPEDPVRFLLDYFEEVLETSFAKGDVTKVSPGTIHSKMFFDCSIKKYGTGQEITHYYAKRLVASMNPKWYKSPFFAWLKAQRDKPWESATMKAEDVPGQCVRRVKKTSATNQPRATAGKHFPAVPRRSGKNAALRPGGSSKRPLSDAERYGDDDFHTDEDLDDRRPSKIARPSPSDDGESDEDEEIDMTQDAAPAVKTYSTTPIPAPVIPAETVRVVVQAGSIPSMSPTGANGTWKCQEEDCDFIVRTEHTPDSEDLISQHFAEHTKRADKINLALAEGTRGRLPINHLLEKIRTLSEASSKGNEKKSNNAEEPKYRDPIKRRLLI